MTITRFPSWNTLISLSFSYPRNFEGPPVFCISPTPCIPGPPWPGSLLRVLSHFLQFPWGHLSKLVLSSPVPLFTVYLSPRILPVLQHSVQMPLPDEKASWRSRPFLWILITQHQFFMSPYTYWNAVGFFFLFFAYGLALGSSAFSLSHAVWHDSWNTVGIQWKRKEWISE